MKANEVVPGRWNGRGQTAQEVDWRQHQGAGAIWREAFHSMGDLPIGKDVSATSSPPSVRGVKELNIIVDDPGMAEETLKAEGCSRHGTETDGSV